MRPYYAVFAVLMSTAPVFAMGPAPVRAPAASAPATSLSVAQSTSTVAPLPPARLEKVHLTISTLTDQNAGLSLYQINESIHHDGDPVTLSTSSQYQDLPLGIQVVIGIAADPNDTGSRPIGYALRADSNGVVAAKISCSSIYYCSTGLTFTTIGVGMGSTSYQGIPSGHYTLSVRYQDGSSVVHGLTFNGVYGSGNFGFIDEEQISSATRPF